MNCDVFRNKIDDLIDATLDAETELACHEHLAACNKCRVEFDACKTLLTRASALPKSVEPTTDLWSGIRSRLEAPQNAHTFPTHRTSNALRYGSLGTLAALLLLSFALGAYWRSQTGANGMTSVHVTTSGSAVSHAAYQEAEAEYAKAKDHLIDVLRARKDEMPPETYMVIEQNLEIVDKAIGEIRVALNASPDNPGLTEMLFAAYRTHVQLLEEAAGLTSQG
jgi:hypothetical protein